MTKLYHYFEEILKFNSWHISLNCNCCWKTVARKFPILFVLLLQKCVRLAAAVVQSLLILVSSSLWSAWQKPMPGWGCHQKLKMWMWRKLEGKCCKESQPFGQSVLACSSSSVILTSSKGQDYSSSAILIFQKNLPFPLGKLRTELTGPITKSTRPRVLDTPFFAHWTV